MGRPGGRWHLAASDRLHGEVAVGVSAASVIRLAPVKRILTAVSLALCCSCGLSLGPEADAGAQDSGSSDAGLFDAGVIDSGFTDAGFTDAGAKDAGVIDAGKPDSGAADSGSSDSGSMDSGITPDAGTMTFAVYPAARDHSPLTEFVAANLRAIAAKDLSRKVNVFAKIGDSNTVNPNYAACYAGASVDLSTRSALQPTLTHFKAGVAGTTTPFDRTTQAAVVGWSASAALAGSPSPLEKEIDAISPRFGTVMFGTNDIGDGTGNVFNFGRNMFSIADQMIAKGVVPILSSIPPRDDATQPNAAPRVPSFNAVIRGLAQARQVPFVDLNRGLLPIPSHGIGSDGLHLNVYSSGGAKGCVLTPAALQFGHNVRNALLLESLDRSLQAVQGQTAPDVTAPSRTGQGSAANPFEIDAFPFTDLRDTSKFGSTAINSYPGCASAADESGREVFYKLTVTAATAVRIFVVSLGTADIDVHLLNGAATGAACTIRNDREIATTLQPGTWFLSLDTYATGGVKAGEYLLVVLKE